MHFRKSIHPLTQCVLLAFVLGVIARPAQAQSYSPEHPKVQAMVDRGLQFLAGTDREGPRGEYGSGETILVGYTILKATGDVDHPQVKAAIDEAARLINGLSSMRNSGESKIVYEASIAAVLLATADPGKYLSHLQIALGWFESIQKNHGGFGYLGRPTGDTSQVQYVMLALWTMEEVGLDIPAPMVESTIRYLKATLDPSGGWGYQGKVSTGGGLIAQESVTKSLATAGVGAVVIAGDILKFYGERKQKADESDGVPAAFVRVDLRKKLREQKREVTMSRSDTDGVIAMARRYQNTTNFSGLNWYYYWRYSQERYESFVEIVENEQSKSPAWYNQGVEELAGLQATDGSWGGVGRGKDVTTVPVSTSFAVLFLIRSTQKAIGKLDEGVTFGGYGLPKDVSTVKMVGDRLVSDEETSVENLLAMLEQEEASDVQIGLLPDNLQLTKDPVQRREQVARLSRLLVSGDYNARRVAAKLLGRSEDISQVPDLIYALSDEDPYVPMIAEESLRLLSRKLNSGKLGVQPEPAERAAAEKFWKEWYLGLRPDYIFLDR